VNAGKAYISSLGTTGLLIASSVLLLVVVGAIFASLRRHLFPDA
jgi:uncharacterized membrane protein